MVTWATIRPPALLVKIVTTLDVLSGGRAWLGVGAGYRGDEAAMIGLPFEPTAERFSRLEELLQLAAHMWNGDRAAFDGPHHHLEHRSTNHRRSPGPRVLIGGMGEQRTLPLVARYADACNLFDIPDGGATLRHKLDVLARACDAAGRDPDDIEVTLSSRLARRRDRRPVHRPLRRPRRPRRRPPRLRHHRPVAGGRRPRRRARRGRTDREHRRLML